MKLPPPLAHRRIELTVLPMVNVVFLLLIFFMLIGRFASTDALDVSPPVSRTGETERVGSVRIVVASDGRMLVDGQETHLLHLKDSITRHVKQDPGAHFQLKIDANLDANGLIELIEILRGSGARELNLLIEHKR